MSSKDDSIFALREVKRKFDPPWDLEIAMAIKAPQALLRDLHRPVDQFTVSPGDFERFERPTGCGVEAMREVHADLGRSLRVPIVDLLRTSREMRSEWSGVKAILQLPWSDAPKFGKRFIPEGLSRKWFGDR
jgi:hypothetical protein